jgi:hypothetical protein
VIVQSPQGQPQLYTWSSTCLVACCWVQAIIACSASLHQQGRK